MPYEFPMMGGAGGGLLVGWIFFALLLALMVLGIVALWKYVTKK